MHMLCGQQTCLAKASFNLFESDKLLIIALTNGSSTRKLSATAAHVIKGMFGSQLREQETTFVQLYVCADVRRVDMVIGVCVCVCIVNAYV